MALKPVGKIQALHAPHDLHTLPAAGAAFAARMASSLAYSTSRSASKIHVLQVLMRDEKKTQHAAATRIYLLINCLSSCQLTPPRHALASSLLSWCSLKSIFRFCISEFCAQRRQRQGPDSILERCAKIANLSVGACAKHTCSCAQPKKTRFPALRLRRHFPFSHAALYFCPGLLRTIKVHAPTDVAELHTVNWKQESHRNCAAPSKIIEKCFQDSAHVIDVFHSSSFPHALSSWGLIQLIQLIPITGRCWSILWAEWLNDLTHTMWGPQTVCLLVYN